MASIRQQILTEIQNTLAAAAGVDADQVKIQRRMPTDRSGMLVNIIPGQDVGERVDGDGIRRTLTVTIACIVPMDASEPGTSFEQATDGWEKIEPQIESLFQGSSYVDWITEAAQGVSWITLDDRHGTYAAVGCDYEIVYERTLTQTS